MTWDPDDLTGLRHLGLGPTCDLADLRSGYDAVTDLWAGTVERARALDPALLHEQVDGEWSFVETLRHLVFATECWVGRTLAGDPSPWHPMSLPWDQMPDTPGVPRDRAARPSLDEALALRADRRELVHRVLDGLTDADLATTRTVPPGPGWPPAGEEVPVDEAIAVVLNEEWYHRQYAERDLGALERRAS